MPRHDTDTNGGRTDQELVCLHGHAETRDRFRELDRSEEHIEHLEEVAEGYADFARVVAATVRYERQAE